MPEANNEAQCFYENLIDIGLGDEMITQCVQLKSEGKYKELLKALQGSRKDLLDDIHAEQKKLDRLDYLVYQLSKKEDKK